MGKQILWGWKGDFGKAEAKGPINSCGHLEASEGVFFANLRGTKATVNMELYLRKI